MSSPRSFLTGTIVFASAALSIAGVSKGAPGDPCSLLTTEQVSAALGTQVEAGKAVGPKMCQWLVPNQPNSLAGKKVAVTLQDMRGFNYAKMPVNDSRITKTPVSGIGDEAVQGTTVGKVTTLSVRKGDSAFTVHVTGFPVEQAQSMEKSLALQILPKF
jgi:hypothetical protein